MSKTKVSPAAKAEKAAALAAAKERNAAKKALFKQASAKESGNPVRHLPHSDSDCANVLLTSILSQDKAVEKSKKRGRAAEAEVDEQPPQKRKSYLELDCHKPPVYPAAIYGPKAPAKNGSTSKPAEIEEEEPEWALEMADMLEAAPEREHLPSDYSLEKYGPRRGKLAPWVDTPELERQDALRPTWAPAESETDDAQWAETLCSALAKSQAAHPGCYFADGTLDVEENARANEIRV